MKDFLFLLFSFLLTRATETKVDNAYNTLGSSFAFRPYDGSKNMPRNIMEGMLALSDREPTRKQPVLPKVIEFPCPNPVTIGRSPVKPVSVHTLRPGDIDVVAAIGDSLTAGNGAMENFALGTFIEHRGVSWCAGGDGNWREYLTLPNILKEFNPQIRGFSTGKAQFPSPPSGMNVAFPVSADEDALKQAKQLVQKMKRDSKTDFQNDWKLVTIFIGANDLCSAQCYNKEKTTPAAHSFKLQMALDYLQNNMPRAFVNLVPVIDVTVSVRVKQSFICKMMHRLFCSCYHHQPGDVMATLTSLSKQYQEAEKYLISTGRYNKKDDFTVVVQPFMRMFNAPNNPAQRLREVIDISYITYDCFHFSQKGHALAANLLWNNMLEPIGQKSTKRLRYLMEKFYCPTWETPYFFTYNNSVNFFQTGRQI